MHIYTHNLGRNYFRYSLHTLATTLYTHGPCLQQNKYDLTFSREEVNPITHHKHERQFFDKEVNQIGLIGY